MSLGGVLNMARTAMSAQQMAIQVASQNISNAETEGYSRQRVDLATSLPTMFPYGSVGTGVKVVDISRARDALLDLTFRQDSAGASAADAKGNALSQVQSIFGEPSDSGLSATLDKFWSAWSDLSSNPTNAAAKGVVLEAGNNVAGTLNRFAASLDNLDQTNRQAMNDGVNRVNELTGQLSKYNVQIVSAESNGQSANDLRDARDNILDELTKIVGGQVIEHDNGSVAVYMGGQMLIDDTTIKTLQMNDGQPPTVSYAGTTRQIDTIGGSLGAEISVSAKSIPSVMSRLDSLAKGIVQTINTAHSAGTVFTGSPPVSSAAGNFFDVTASPPASGDPLLTARGMRVLPGLTSGMVTASGAGALGPGNNDVALAMAQLRTSTVALTDASGGPVATASLGGFFNDTVSQVATATQQAQDDSTVQSTLASNADLRRKSVSGVSTDEELIAVIQHQHAYQAAARLVNVVNDMTDTLVNLGR